MPPVPIILVTGKNGQVGGALPPILSALGHVVAFSHDECDLADPSTVARIVETVRPTIIVNAAAYTAVDKAQSNEEQAFAVNAIGPGVLAQAAKKVNAALIHYSTDYVFDGRKATPYCETDPTNPLSVYGASKRAGEIAVCEALPEHLILRTSWVFSARGRNFLNTMLRLARERDELAVVADQLGAPTSAGLLARVSAHMAQAILRDKSTIPYGTYHVASAGETSWHGYASFAIERARHLGLPIRVATAAITPIAASAYPAAAPRPANSRLNLDKLRTNFGIAPPLWQDDVDEILKVLAQS